MVIREKDQNIKDVLRITKGTRQLLSVEYGLGLLSATM